ncbi:MAG TPA: hypothetical protein VF665_01785 [Longimicrobium sp.]|jgi:hypothetical protein|uniref:hypothetical protein n=1 Tax=Longimicrobium sp. TaxID=2029185 RepID=UPI002ED89FE4
MRTHVLVSALSALTLLAACSGGGSGGGSVTATDAVASAGCAAAASFALQPGETRVLTEAEARCFALTKSDGEYALAGYDARALDAARDRQATGGFSEPRYTVADQSRGPSAFRAAASRSATDEVAPAGDLHNNSSSAGTDGEVYARSTPWREGERFAVKPMTGTGTVPAKVVAVEGRFVLAVIESDADGAGGMLDQSEKALRFLAGQGETVLAASFGGDAPVTSTASGQLLVLAAAWPADKGAAATWTQDDASGTRSMVWLNTNLRGGRGEGFDMYDHVSYRVKTLAHELTHAWQVRWVRSAGHAAPASAAWSLEGGADLMGMDLLRRYLEVGVAANWHWTDYLDARRPGVIYALEPADARGRVTWGYYDAASLLRDLQMRLVSSGMNADAALAEVSRGAVEGWYGDDGEGGTAGLVERMRARMGGSWDPAAAVLTWTLTQAADDRTSNPALNNPVYHAVSGPDSYYGWKAAAEVRTGNGAAQEFTQVAGGSFFVTLKGGSPAATLSATATVPGSRWMIARIK